MLVQGPPGTGKSHTISNLICHLLATGHRLLVTSHAARALRVLKDYFPEEISPLCVSLLGDDTTALRELEESVQGILNRLNVWDTGKSRICIHELESDLDQSRREMAETYTRLKQIRVSETQSIDLGFGGYRGTSQFLAQRLASEAAQFDWLPEDIPFDVPPPLTNSEALELLALVRELGDDGDKNARKTLPEIASLFEPPAFDELVLKERELTAKLHSVDLQDKVILQSFAAVDLSARNSSEKALCDLSAALDSLAQQTDAWIGEARQDVLLGKYQGWEALHAITINKVTAVASHIPKVSELKISGLDQRDRAVVRADAEVLQTHLASGKSLGISVKYNPFAPKGVRAALYLTDQVRVNGRPCDSPAAIADLLDFIEVTEAVDYIGQQWSPYVQARQMPIALTVREHERRAEVLYEILQLRQLAAVASAALKQVRGLAQINFNDKQALGSMLVFLRMATLEDELRDLRQKLACLMKQLASFRRDPDANPLISDLMAAVESRDLDSYSRTYDRVVSAWSFRSRCQRREALERRLHGSNLAMQISSNPNVWDKRLEYFESAWNWARANNWLKQQSDPRQESAHLEKVDISQKRIRHDLSELAAYKAWEYVLARLKPEQREHLMAWKLAIKKIGKGTGKYATQYRKEARYHLDHCRGAIPAWVMPIYRVAETTKPEPNMFDVAIIDEASQSGPEALFLLYIAKKIVVVGDDQQISPESVGLDREAVDSLRQRYIRDVPHWDALGVDNSFFDQAQIRFAGRIRLREHFRCMPEIIQFSNNLCYQAEPLIPLRQYGVERLVPVVTRHVRDGYAKGLGDRIVNRPEAEAIVEQIAQCLIDPAYDRKSFGVICLQGNAQWNLIRELLMDRIGAQKMQQRRLAGGNAYAFQGDERDIIFLSMVAAANDGRHIGVLSKEADKRRFNVAASRARDQMWLFHSVTLDDLSAHCFRRQLLEYCLNPTAKPDTIPNLDTDHLRRQASEANRGDSRAPLPFDSWFEVDVFLRIVDRGFRVIPQYPIAGKRIDLLVEGMQGRLAVECDGDQWHGIQEWDADVDRQRMLERCGLQFWRVRGSAFYRSPDSVLDSLWRLLQDRGICATTPHAHAIVQEPGVTSSGQVSSLDSADEEDFGDGISLAVDHEPEIEAPDEGQRSLYSSGPEVGLPITLAPYEKWVPDAAPDPNSVSLPELMEGLVDIVAIEGPMVCHRAYLLYNRAAGNARLGSQIVRLMNRAMYRAVRLGSLQQSDERRRGGQINQIVRIAGTPEVVVRQRGPRRLEEIPPLEIEAIREALLCKDPSLGEDQLVRNLAGVYGIGRVTAQIRRLLLG